MIQLLKTIFTMPRYAYYAVARGRNVGIYSTWDECRAQVEGFQNAKYKKFGCEAEAEDFIDYYASGVAQRPPVRHQPEYSYNNYSNPAPRYASPPHHNSSRSYHNESNSGWNDTEVVYTDGACSNNGRSHAKAGWGVYYGRNDPRNCCGAVRGEATNNRGELQAVLVAMENAINENKRNIIIRTDSQLLINSLDNWISKWERNGWRTSTGPVKNIDLLQDIQDKRRFIDVKFEHVPAHVGIEGNEAADALARQGARDYY